MLAGGAALLERLSELPGGNVLLELAAGREDVELIGGAVRDLLLGRTPRELDVVVGADARDGGSLAHAAPLFARALAARLGALAGVEEHESFGTALVRWEQGRVDIATRRSESYAAPGALPAVAVGTPEQDLARRDFTVNAIALALGGPRRGELRTVPGALEDLRAGCLRVLHERSFAEDPTRLLRLARYAARLGFAIEPSTEALAEAALAAGVLATVSGGRVGAELRLALGEPDASGALAEFDRLGLLGALHPRLRFEALLVQRALALLPADGRADLLLLAAVGLPLTLRADGERDAELRALLDGLQFSSTDRDRVIAAALAAPELIDSLAGSPPARGLYEAAHAVPVEGVALAGALGGERSGAPQREQSGALGGEGLDGRDGALEGARRWIEELRQVRLLITGDDLIAAGIASGPELGRRLHATLMLRLDGELEGGREAELAAALTWSPE